MAHMPPSPSPSIFDRAVVSPVGGRLQRFAAEWEVVTSDRWVLGVVSEGYRLEFTSPPPPFHRIRSTPIPVEAAKALALLDEVVSLVKKEAVSRIMDEASGLYSTFFLTTKKSGEWRPILNLKPLNAFIRPRAFRMETLSAVLNVLKQGCWGATLDLKDAYLHVPVHPHSRKWLRFRVRDQSYQFKVLPFGLSTSPRVFTRIVKIVAEYLRPRGYTLFIYLDDFLVIGQSREALQKDLADVRELLVRLGFIINDKKSRPTPTQRVQFLGAVIDFKVGRVYPLPERIVSVQECAEVVRTNLVVEAGQFLRLLGLMSSLVDVVPWCRAHMRVLQLHLATHYRPWVHPLTRRIPVPPSLHKALKWWEDPDHLRVGVPFPHPPPNVVITTDASKFGWGAHLLDIQVSGVWSRSQRRCHINLLELWAVFLALRRFRRQVIGQSVLVRSDNISVVTYLNRQGGTHSPSLCKQVVFLLAWCETRSIFLKGVHVPGVENVLADALSRGMTPSKSQQRIRGSSVDWHLQPRICLDLFKRLGRPLIDLFASKRNHQLPTYYTWELDGASLGKDALEQDWSGMYAYAFPPIALIPRVLLKLSRTTKCRVLLIAPFWPRQLWFSQLLDLLVSEPVRLPVREDLLTVSESRSRVPLRVVQALGLTAWTISAVPILRRAFLKRLPVSHSRQGDRLQDRLIITDSKDFVCGVNGYRVTPILHL